MLVGGAWHRYVPGWRDVLAIMLVLGFLALLVTVARLMARPTTAFGLSRHRLAVRSGTGQHRSEAAGNPETVHRSPKSIADETGKMQRGG